jgi:hypothetical protein
MQLFATYYFHFVKKQTNNMSARVNYRFSYSALIRFILSAVYFQDEPLIIKIRSEHHAVQNFRVI